VKNPAVAGAEAGAIARFPLNSSDFEMGMRVAH
jgi:hypothetical protein